MTPSAFRELRKSLNLTQEQLAAHLGLSRRAVWCYETGRSQVPRTVEMAVQGLRPGDAPPPEPPIAWLVEGAPLLRAGAAPSATSAPKRWFPLARADTRDEATAYKRKLQVAALRENHPYVYRVRRTRAPQP